MAAVLADGALKGRRQSTQGGAAQRATGRAGQHTTGHCSGRQTFRTAGDIARRAKQLPALTAEDVRQPQPFCLGRDLSHPPCGAGEVESSPGQNIRPPGERRPACKGGAPGQGQAHSLPRPAFPLQYQRRQPGEGVELGGEGPAGTGPVPWILGCSGLQTGAGQDEAAIHNSLAGCRISRPEVAGSRREGLHRGPFERQAVARQAVEFDPKLSGQHPADDGRPKAGSGGRAGGSHRRPHRRPTQAGDLAGRGRIGLGPGKAT